MREWEKAQLGKPHFFDDEMMRLFQRACRLTREYNQTNEEETTLREEILQSLIKKKGKNIYIIPDFHCEFGSNISIGDDVVINTHCMLMDNTDIVIGNQVLIGPNVSLYTVNHAISPEERASGICIAKPIHIGNGVWIGGDVQVTAGVTIGDNSVIGAGSVVTKDIPSGVIAAGNPCRVIRKIKEDKINVKKRKESIMSKRILILSTSPRRGGNTESLCEAFMDGAQSVGKDVEKININDLHIVPCMGCDACQGKSNRCVQEDDMQQILEKMNQADAVVFATPIYFYNMSGQLKILLDRTYSQYRTLGFKKAVLIAACADEESSSFDVAVKGFEEYLRCLPNAENAGTILASGVFDKAAVSEGILKKAGKLGEEI